MKILDSFRKISLTPVIGIEVEFYLKQPDLEGLLTSQCKKASKLFSAMEKEKGFNQFEIQTYPTTDIQLLIKEIALMKEILLENVNLSAKPFLDKPGSSLHVHINLIKNDGTNLFDNKNNLLLAISGLCKFMKPSMLIFAPNVSCYRRFQYPDENTPTTISWGYNNRTTALRVVANRIEHRVACAESNADRVLEVVLAGLLWGIKNQEHETISPTYGIASNNQAEQLPRTFSEAKRHYQEYSDVE